ncbi:MAG TPA: ABC transporter permease [Myxococcaceae bacterium]|nr:ABC transporter permease [Myxococcaceae bacterium]
MAGVVWHRFSRHRMAVASLGFIAALAVVSIFVPWLSPYDPDKPQLASQFRPPSPGHLMGTDDLGRDLLTRILYGGRISMSIGVLAMALAVVIGTTIGALAGYYGRWADNLLMRLTDLMLSIPGLFLLILMTLLLRSFSIPFLSSASMVPAIVLAIALLSWMTVARLVRASFLSLKEAVFVEAARAAGAGNPRIMIRHILPSAASPIIVAATLRVASSIITESGLSYLGFGVQLPTPTWGNMLRNAQDQMIVAPWTAIFPGVFIFFTVIAINYIGDGLRDALDPRHLR